MEISREEMAAEIGIGIHTGLRKAVDSKESSAAWSAINSMDDTEWWTVLSFCAEGLTNAGYRFIRNE